MFLSRLEVRRLTGCAHRAAQAARLRAQGIRYTLDVDGWPIVLRLHVERRLDGAAGRPDEAAPNFAALAARG